MSLTPPTVYMRRGQVMDWLEEYGINRSLGRKLIETGVIKRIQFTPNGWSYSSRAQIQRDILDKTTPPTTEGNPKNP